jgi:NADPH:quinone reductase-like Zn-dependent oxidoreductase
MMKAVRYHDCGGPGVLCCEEAPTPKPGPEAAARGLRGEYAAARPGTALLNRIAELVDDRKLKPDVGTVLSLREARQAHELIQTGHTRGKIVLRVTVPSRTDSSSGRAS